MRHEQEYNRHRRHPEGYRHMPGRHPEHQHDFGSRWGEPEPRLGPGANERDMYQSERRSDRDDFYHSDWRPFEHPKNRHYRDRDRDHEQDYHQEPPVWRQQDVHFSRENQHANDRWHNNRYEPRPHPNEHPRHTAEHFYRQERRRRY